MDGAESERSMEDKLADLEVERDLRGETTEQAADRMFKEHLLQATQAICNIAVYGSTEKLKLQAAQYVVERNLGRLGDRDPLANTDPFELLLAECVKDVGPLP
jgi:hypothetical protein